MDKLLPFPPYTPASAARRFPGDPVAIERIGLLYAWLVDQALPAGLIEETGVSLRTLYRLRQIWQNEGMIGLLARTPQPSAYALGEDDVRTLINTLGKRPSFALGCSAEARKLLPHIGDPATRGRILQHTLTAALHETDSSLAASHGFPCLLERRFLQHESIDELTRSVAMSPRHIHRLLAQALEQIAAHLPALLRAAQPPVPLWAAYRCEAPQLDRNKVCILLMRSLVTEGWARLIGELPMGRSSIAALADTWAHAGWNVLWARYDPGAECPISALILTLYAQLAEIGVLETARPDPLRLHSEHLRRLEAVMNQLPTLLIIDDAAAAIDNPHWTSTLQTLSHRRNMLRFLSIGRHRAGLLGPEIVLEEAVGEVPRYARMYGGTDTQI